MSQTLSLSRLLLEKRRGDRIVARRFDASLRADHELTWADLKSHVAGLSRRVSGSPGADWLVLTDDAFAFAVSLLALWHAGRYAVSPPNGQPGTLRALQTRTAGVLTDRPEAFGDGECVDPLDHATTDPWQAEPLDPDAPAVELFTSGTTGAEKPVIKQLRHLEGEVDQFGESWDAELGDATVLSTCTHQHLYGLLHGVLWPLCAGRVFQSRHLLLPVELRPRMEAGPCILASVPTHLARLARWDDLRELRGHCLRVFSSGGPLATETAHRVGAALGHPPVELLGSTEAGGIAWRVQQPGRSDAWTPLPGVGVSRDPEDGVARVRSPYVSVEHGAEGFATGDRITFEDDGRFRLDGRADRMVKVGERRLDLVPMESHLRANPLVDDAALAARDQEGEQRVCAALTPSAAGWQLLKAEGRRAFGRALARHFADDWEPVLHPRQWRAVGELPRNAMGKVTRSAVLALFEPAVWGELASERPELLREAREAGALERLCRVPEYLACLAGHFPGNPIVPGALILGWVTGCCAALLDRTPAPGTFAPRGFEGVRFRAPLRPGDAFTLRVETVEPDERGSLRFSVATDEGEAASGRLRAGPPEKRG